MDPMGIQKEIFRKVWFDQVFLKDKLVIIEQNFLQPSHPWDWYIYLQNWVVLGVNVGKVNMGVSLNGGTPKTPQVLIIFIRKTHGCWGNPAF